MCRQYMHGISVRREGHPPCGMYELVLKYSVISLDSHLIIPITASDFMHCHDNASYCQIQWSSNYVTSPMVDYLKYMTPFNGSAVLFHIKRAPGIV